jgi:ppGpp synthetase/RelA/SpoT-type nucleotidyltranferase
MQDSSGGVRASSGTSFMDSSTLSDNNKGNHFSVTPASPQSQQGKEPQTITDFSNSPTTAEKLSQSTTTAERLANSPSPMSIAEQSETKENTSTQGYNLSPLAGPTGMAARREFYGIPFRSEDAYQAYKGMTADSFAGPDDIRLRQLSKSLEGVNDNLSRQLNGTPGIDGEVSGRAKTPFSTFGKLRETPDTTIGQIKDLSGLRVNLSPNQPDFQEYYKTQDAIQETLGDNLQLKKDYIKQPNPWGYTGRIHSILTEPGGLAHEIQVGSSDLSNFIDGKLTTTGGDHIALHDATGYKGQIYGAQVPDHLQSEYTRLMQRITDVNGAGQQVTDVPELQREINQYNRAVEESLPAKLNKPPEPELSAKARMGNFAAKGLGVLGLAGGTLQTANGINTLSNGGDRIEGSADVGAGSTAVVSSVALMGGRMMLGTTTGGAAAIIDGARDVYVGVRDGSVEKTAVGTIKAGAGTAMIAGIATANPILIAGGAVAYCGAAVYESRDAIASAAKGAWNWATSWI